MRRLVVNPIPDTVRPVVDHLVALAEAGGAPDIGRIYVHTSQIRAGWQVVSDLEAAGYNATRSFAANMWIRNPAPLTSLSSQPRRQSVVADPGTTLVVGVDPDSKALCVIPRDQAEEDVEFIAALARASTFGELRQHRGAWLEVAYSSHFDEEGEEVDPHGLSDDTPFDYGEWFGEDALLHVPQARLQTAELCPAPVLDRFAYDDDGVGFVGYERARWLDPDDRDAIEAMLRELGYLVEADEMLIARYLDL